MKQQPDGFTISFNRYDSRKRWGWKQTKGIAASMDAGHVVQRDGLKSRRAALVDLLAELDRRSTIAPPSAAEQPTMTT